MSPEQMRALIRKAYNGPYWWNKVDKMSVNQVVATYYSMLNRGQLKGIN